jgi:hypothetical protein
MVKRFVSVCVAVLLVCTSIVVGADQVNKTSSEKLIGNINLKSLVPGSLVFSPDGNHVAYVVKVDDKLAANLDGISGPKYNGIGFRKFSPDGRHFAYVAISGNESFIVLDGKEGPKYDYVIKPQFANSSRLAYIAKSKNRSFMVVDGKEESKYDNITAIKFSQKGDHYFYIALQNKSQFVVFDGQRGPSYDRISAAELNQEGTHLAYIVLDEFFKKQFVVLDSRKGKEYDAIIILNSGLFDQEGNLTYIGIRGSEAYLVREILKS